MTGAELEDRGRMNGLKMRDDLFGVGGVGVGNRHRLLPSQSPRRRAWSRGDY